MKKTLLSPLGAALMLSGAFYAAGEPRIDFDF